MYRVVTRNGKITKCETMQEACRTFLEGTREMIGLIHTKLGKEAPREGEFQVVEASALVDGKMEEGLMAGIVTVEGTFFSVCFVAFPDEEELDVEEFLTADPNMQTMGRLN